MVFINRDIGEVTWGDVAITQNYLHTELKWEALDEKSKRILLMFAHKDTNQLRPLVVCKRTEKGIDTSSFWLVLLGEEDINENTISFIDFCLDNNFCIYGLFPIKLSAVEVIALVSDL